MFCEAGPAGRSRIFIPLNYSLLHAEFHSRIHCNSINPYYAIRVLSTGAGVVQFRCYKSKSQSVCGTLLKFQLIAKGLLRFLAAEVVSSKLRHLIMGYRFPWDALAMNKYT